MDEPTWQGFYGSHILPTSMAEDVFQRKDSIEQIQHGSQNKNNLWKTCIILRLIPDFFIQKTDVWLSIRVTCTITCWLAKIPTHFLWNTGQSSTKCKRTVFEYGNRAWMQTFRKKNLKCPLRHKPRCVIASVSPASDSRWLLTTN